MLSNIANDFPNKYHLIPTNSLWSPTLALVLSPMPKVSTFWISLVVHWLRFHGPNTKGPGMIPRSGKEIPHAVTKTWCSQILYIYIYIYTHTHTHTRESQWTPGVGDGQGGLACCDSWGHKESDTTERLIWSDLIWNLKVFAFLVLPVPPDLEEVVKTKTYGF